MKTKTTKTNQWAGYYISQGKWIRLPFTFTSQQIKYLTKGLPTKSFKVKPLEQARKLRGKKVKTNKKPTHKVTTHSPASTLAM